MNRSLQSVAIAVLKIPSTGYLLSDIRSNFIHYFIQETSFGIGDALRKSHQHTYLREKDATREYHAIQKNNVYFVDTKLRKMQFWDTVVSCGSQYSHN